MPPTTPDFWYEMGNAPNSTSVLPSDRSTTSTFPFTFSTRPSTMNAQSKAPSEDRPIKPLTAKEYKKLEKIAVKYKKEIEVDIAKYEGMSEEEMFAVAVREVLADYRQFHNVASDDDSDGDDDDGDESRNEGKVEIVSKKENPYKGVSPATSSTSTTSVTSSTADGPIPDLTGTPPSAHIHSPSTTNTSPPAPNHMPHPILEKDQESMMHIQQSHHERRMQADRLEHERNMQADRLEHEKELLRMRCAFGLKFQEGQMELEKHKHEQAMRRIELEQERDLKKAESSEEYKYAHAMKKTALEHEQGLKKLELEHEQGLKRLEQEKRIKELELAQGRDLKKMDLWHVEKVIKDQEERKNRIAEAALDIGHGSAGEEEKKPDESS